MLNKKAPKTGLSTLIQVSGKCKGLKDFFWIWTLKCYTTKSMITKSLNSKDFRWVAWSEKDVEKAGNDYISYAKEIINKIKSVGGSERTFENTILPLEFLERKSDQLLSPIGLLLNASENESVRKKAEEVINQIESAVIDLFYDPELYKAISEYKPRKSDLASDEQILYSDTIKQFKRMGFELPKQKQNILKNKKKELAKLSNQFQTTINQYSDFILVTREQLDGLPETYIEQLSKEKGKYKVTLEYPLLFPFMDYAKDEAMRKKLSEKKSRHGGKVNLVRLEKIVKLRKGISEILGYPNHSEYVLEDRMAKKSKNVTDFLNNLEKKTRKQGQIDIAHLKSLKKADSKNPFGSHDFRFYSQKSLSLNFTVDNEMVREYFPLEHVKNEAYNLFEKLFNVKISKSNLPTWHKDVETYEITDKKTKGIIGYFSLDLYPRKGKYGHAAVFGIGKGHQTTDENYHPGYSVMLGNFRNPTKKSPTLLSHDEVLTFMHEFGHILHGSLTTARFASQAGTAVAWDFVELPSQLMEQWLWTPSVLKKFSKHYKTGEQLPKKVIDNLVLARKHLNAISTRRQIAFASFDIELHTKGTKSAKELYNSYAEKILGIKQSEGSLMPAGFGHMVGYDSGYYSYLWAIVFAFDVFGEFKKSSLLSSSIGQKLRKEILEKGSSRDEMESLKKFLGRNPNDGEFVQSLS